MLIIADRLIQSDIFGPIDLRTGEMERLGGTPGSLPVVGDLRVGLLGPSPVGRKNPFAVYATASAGCSSRGGDYIGDAYSADEPIEGTNAATVYRRRTGLPATPGSVVHLQTGPILRANEKLYNPTQVGYLGEKLKRAGVRTAVFGNSDLPGLPSRPAVTIAMDERGIVRRGDVSSRCLREDRNSPTGVVTNVPALTRMVRDALRSSDFIVVDFGDTARLEAVRPLLSPQAYEKHLRSSLDSLWRLVRGINGMRRMVDRVFVVSLSPRLSDEGDWDSLTPILIYERGPVGVRLLQSETTRIPGMVTAIDLAPTILRLYGVDAAEAVGRPFEAAEDEPAETLPNLDRQVRVNQHAEMPILGTLGGIGVVVITTATVIVTFLVPVSSFVAGLLRFLILCLASAPLGLLIAPNFHADSAPKLGLAVAICVISIAAVWRLIGWRLNKTGNGAGDDLSLAISLLATALFLMAAGLTGWGDSSLRFSLVSGSLISGMRYYGIGNEYMAFLVGGLLVACLWFGQAFAGRKGEGYSNAAFGLLFALAILAMAPAFGANTGGIITAVVTFGLAYIAISGKKFGWRQVAVLAVLGVLLTVTLGLLDFASHGWKASHLGRALAAFSDGQAQYPFAVFARKFLLNFRLLGTRQAILALLGFSPFFVLWLAGTQRRVNDYLERIPKLRWGLIAGLVGAGAAFLFNDSGIISAFIMLACMVVALLYSILEHNTAHYSPNE